MTEETADAAEVQIHAADWLMERREGEWSAEKQAGLDAWLAQSLEHRIAYWRLDAAWGRADLLGAMRRPSFERPQPAPKRKVWLLRVAAAAVVAVVAGVTLVPEFGKSSEKIYATALGERERLTLADGSQIELNTDTVLRTQISASAREIWLDRGEVYFEVTHNEKKPFVVMVGSHRITDIGTKFVVRRDTGQFKVTVLEGRVRIENPDNAASRSELLTQGDIAVTVGNRIAVVRENKHAIADALGWQRGVLIFDHTTLAEAAREFNRYSGRKLVIPDRRTAQLTIDGTFPSNNAQAFTRLAQAVLGLKIEDRGNEVIISK